LNIRKASFHCKQGIFFHIKNSLRKIGKHKVEEKLTRRVARYGPVIGFGISISGNNLFTYDK
jgi:hypothetical protein